MIWNLLEHINSLTNKLVGKTYFMILFDVTTECVSLNSKSLNESKSSSQFYKTTRTEAMTQ
ncbi:hypothetical protein Syun_016790 [Stephania yunnanensis]|uniref:Uncharacterized protein n=1 Tax=Stephania yunnanensis TaxID=152371 RepID=A0AAP0J5U9_9MAGN